MNARDKDSVMAVADALHDIPLPKSGKGMVGYGTFGEDMRVAMPLMRRVLMAAIWNDHDEMADALPALYKFMQKRKDEDWK